MLALCLTPHGGAGRAPARTAAELAGSDRGAEQCAEPLRRSPGRSTSTTFVRLRTPETSLAAPLQAPRASSTAMSTAAVAAPSTALLDPDDEDGLLPGPGGVRPAHQGARGARPDPR